MLNLILIELRKRKNSILGWGLGVGAYLAMILAIAPSLAEQFSALDLGSIPVYQAFGIGSSIGTASELIGVYLPFIGLLIGVYAAITGSQALAGEEDKGTLETLVTLPLPRWMIVCAKAIAIEISILAILALCFLGFAVVWPFVSADIDSTITLNKLFIASFEPFALGLLIGMLSLAAGALLPRRAHALWIGLFVTIGGYFFNNLAPLNETMNALKPFQPFHYYQAGDVLTKSFEWSPFISLLIVASALLILATFFFQRRDITVGLWPWQRAGV